PTTANNLAYVYWTYDARQIIAISTRTNLKSSFQLSMYNLTTSTNFREIEVGKIPYISGYFWQIPATKNLVFMQAGANSLLVFYPETATYRTLITGGVLSTSLSSDGHKFLAVHQVDAYVVVDMFRNSEDTQIRLPDE